MWPIGIIGNRHYIIAAVGKVMACYVVIHNEIASPTKIGSPLDVSLCGCGVVKKKTSSFYNYCRRSVLQSETR